MSARSHPAFSLVAHRPWPLPSTPWQWTQTWAKLLFAHWRVPASEIQARLPPGLIVDLFQGEAWLGIVPFELTMRRRWCPPLPGASRFPEINVRTYVTDGRKPGVWFFSLDAQSRLAVWGARRLFQLPYFYARMSIAGSAHEIDYRSERLGDEASFAAQYGGRGVAVASSPGTLEYFLSERYCLYSHHSEHGLFRAEVHHHPWPLQPGWGRIRANSMTRPLGGIELTGEPLLHYVERLDVAVWPLQRVEGVEASPAAAVPCPA